MADLGQAGAAVFRDFSVTIPCVAEQGIQKGEQGISTGKQGADGWAGVGLDSWPVVIMWLGMTVPTRTAKSDWQLKCEAIEAAYREAAESAPHAGESGDADLIPYEFAISGMGRELMLIRPAAFQKMLPPKRALAEVHKSSGRLLKVLGLLPPAAVSALKISQGMQD
jgi:hypothetical protein